MTKNSSKLLPLTFLGPIGLFACLKDGDQVILEGHCSYQKKTNRNRCLIAAANGPLALTVPVEHVKGQKVLTKDARIFNATPWQKQVWRSIESAYQNSPFFMYYADEIAPFFEQPQESLWELNTGLFTTMTELLELDVSITFTDDYTHDDPNILDLRNFADPKTDPALFGIQSVPYRQVFSDKHPFYANLSIIDLLFNKGPESHIVLSEMNRL